MGLWEEWLVGGWIWGERGTLERGGASRWRPGRGSCGAGHRGRVARGVRGGVSARVALAAKAVLAEHDVIPLLVFDEIDSNIGGEVGRAVGERLRAVAAHHQVVAITHLPQSAVYGERHLAVSKTVSGGRTRSTVRVLEGDERVDEIARMLGGASLTSVVERHARELIALAAKK